MEQRKLYFKTDFKIWEACEGGFGVPFRFNYYTNSPKCGWEASFDGTEYHNCALMDDGRLCVAFDDHGLGLGVLKVERRYYLSDEDYRTGVCDEVFPGAPVVCKDGKEEFNLHLTLDGALTALNATSEVPPPYVKGEDAKINGRNTITIEGDAVSQEGDVLTIDSYTKHDTTRLIEDSAKKLDAAITSVRTVAWHADSLSDANAAALETKADKDELAAYATQKDLGNTANALGQSIGSVGTLAHEALVEAQNKQAVLISGQNIKTINGNSLLGEGNITIEGGVSDTYTKEEIDDKLDVKANTEDLVFVKGGGIYSQASFHDHNGVKILNVANGQHSHAEGAYTTASGGYSHAEGVYTTAMGHYSHTEGVYTRTVNDYEHAQGCYNLSITASNEKERTLHSVGNGSSSSAQHNAVELKFNGDYYIQEKTSTDDSTVVTAQAPMKRLQTWLNEKADKSKVVTDVQLNSKSIVENGVANIPIGVNQLGLVYMVDTGIYGIYGNPTYGTLTISKAENSEITAKTNKYKPIVPYTLDFAVKTSITTNTIALTDEEKQKAQEWLGVSATLEGINNVLNKLLGNE